MITSYKDLEDALEKANKRIEELKKKRSKGEINEAYAKTIEADKETIRKLKVKINKLEQRNHIPKYKL